TKILAGTPRTHNTPGNLGCRLSRLCSKITPPRARTQEPMPTFEIFSREPDIRSFNSGQAIFREGDKGDCMFAVVEGTVDIEIDGGVVETVKVGGVFGEMALIDGQPRSATAVASSACRLAAIDEKRFLRLVEVTPRFALQIMQVISQRLRARSH